ncbi:hypothetical protein [Cryptosporangium minutisporangium]|uniref:Glycosyltransferase n=1 Tax=Cryptosporangium minutisporangium TaxID=113569 RepID=A0ABP6SR73_9ACTN
MGRGAVVSFATGEHVHRESHADLLVRPARKAAPGDMDAIVVPATRSVDHLTSAVALADDLGCTLVVLCSRSATSGAVAEQASHRPGLRWIAVDLPDGYEHQLLTFASTHHPKVVHRRSDLSVKRNLGLLLAKMLGWRRILFLDDDIYDVRPEQVREMAGHLGPRAAERYPVVGLRVESFPDNSVVCHAYRSVGGVGQDVFVSGSALGVYLGQFVPFFPQIYNEDWLFLLDDVRRRSVATTGYARQLAFDPYKEIDRARSEEFGDVIAEGLMAQLAYDPTAPGRLGRSFWKRVLARRRTFLAMIAERATDVHVLAAIEAARQELAKISPDDCIRYIAVWQSDLDVWEDDFARLRKFTPADALEYLAGAGNHRLTWLTSDRAEPGPVRQPRTPRTVAELLKNRREPEPERRSRSMALLGG